VLSLAAVVFSFDFGSPIAFLCHRGLDSRDRVRGPSCVRVRAGAVGSAFSRRPAPIAGYWLLPRELFSQAPEYDHLEIERFGGGSTGSRGLGTLVFPGQ